MRSGWLRPACVLARQLPRFPPPRIRATRMKRGRSGEDGGLRRARACRTGRRGTTKGFRSRNRRTRALERQRSRLARLSPSRDAGARRDTTTRLGSYRPAVR
eukprot:667679-Rhodomonas_salina.5